MNVLLHGSPEANNGVYDDFIHEGFAGALGERNVEGFTAFYARGHDSYVESYTDKHKLDELDGFDLIVFENNCYYDKNLEKLVRYNTSATKIVIDTADHFFVQRLYLMDEIKYYFKRELYAQPGVPRHAEWYIRYMYGEYFRKWAVGKMMPGLMLKTAALPYRTAAQGVGLRKLLPFPLTIATKTRRNKAFKKERKYDLNFMMSLDNNIGERHDAYRFIKEDIMPKNGKVYLSTGGLKRGGYEKIASDSKFGVSVRGQGFDTFRYWELPFYGTALLSRRIPLVLPHNFVDGESAIFFGSLEEMKSKFERYAVKTDEWKEIARNGQTLFFKHHTPRKRVEELILGHLE